MHFEAKFPPGAAVFQALIAGMKNLTAQTNLYCTMTFPQSAAGPPPVAGAGAGAGAPQQIPTGASAAAPVDYAAAVQGSTQPTAASSVPQSRADRPHGAPDDSAANTQTGPCVQVQFMDALAGKALVAWQLHRDAFASISLQRDSVLIGICPSELHKYLTHVRDDDTLTLRADTNALGLADIYELYIESADLTRKCLYEIDCVRQSDTLTALPATSYHASFQMSTSELDKTVKSMFEVSPNVSITVGPTSVTFLASGQTSSLQIGLVQRQQNSKAPRESPTRDKDGNRSQQSSVASTAGASSGAGSFVVCNFQSRMSQTFDAKYLLTICAAAAEVSDCVTLNLCRGAPMKVVYDVVERQLPPTEGGAPSAWPPPAREEGKDTRAKQNAASASALSQARKKKVGQVQFYLASEDA